MILPFPGGIVRSGARSVLCTPFASVDKRRILPHAACFVATRLPAGVQSVLEVVIDGLSEQAVAQAMRVGIHAARGAVS